MEHPDIERAINTGHPHGESMPVSECLECGTELASGELRFRMPSTSYYLCSDECALKHYYENGHLDWVVELMLEEGNIERVVLE